ncbi:MAG: hypothetical protein K2I77_04065, partial [Anaeroplasmataceae bacterium]|nr:hypothetical protein [Anaeroplasmataceae bacterium]
MSDLEKTASYYNQIFCDAVEEINQKIQDFSKEIQDKEISLQNLNIQNERKDFNNQQVLIGKQKTLLGKQKAYQESQDAYDNEQKDLLKEYYQLLFKRAKIQIKQYQLLIAQKEYQQAELYKQMPELYLYNEEGIIYGYNKFGSLCMLFDAYEHEVLIEYNEKNQIKDIIDSKNHKIDFIYNTKHQLIRIIDEEDHFIDFIYDQGYLKQFRYSNEEIFKLQYLNDNLYEVVDIDSVGYRLEYKDQLISKLQYFCATNNKIDEEISFVYEANLVSIQSNKNAIKTCYLFDDNQSLTTEYSLKDNVLETITTHDFESNHCSFSMSASKHDTKLLNVSSENINGAKSHTVTLSDPYTSDYILYAFAEANSMANARKRRVTAYCSHIEKESSIHFELRCRLDYTSYQKEYSVSFNPLIRGKQFVAIPITLSKDSSGNVILPNNITIFADYSNNNGTCTISNLALTQGEYNYYEYDEAHHKIFESRSEAIHAQTKSCQKEKTTVQKEEITYIYNPKELLEKETHTITTKEYDLSNSLVSNEQDITTMAYAYNKQGKLIKQQSSLGNVVEYVYNEQGTCILKKSYHESLPNLAYVEEQELDEDGKVIQEKNELGYSLNYQYLNNSLVSTTTPNGNILYTHESNHAVSISSDVNGLENYNTSIYENGRLVEYKTEGMNYRFTYDEFGREKELYINEKKYCTFERILDKDKINYRTIFTDKSGYQKVCDLYD